MTDEVSEGSVELDASLARLRSELSRLDESIGQLREEADRLNHQASSRSGLDSVEPCLDHSDDELDETMAAFGRHAANVVDEFDPRPFDPDEDREDETADAPASLERTAPRADDISGSVLAPEPVGGLAVEPDAAPEPVGGPAVEPDAVEPGALAPAEAVPDQPSATDPAPAAPAGAFDALAAPPSEEPDADAKLPPVDLDIRPAWRVEPPEAAPTEAQAPAPEPVTDAGRDAEPAFGFLPGDAGGPPTDEESSAGEPQSSAGAAASQADENEAAAQAAEDGPAADAGADGLDAIASSESTDVPPDWDRTDADDDAAFDKFFHADVEPEPAQRWLLND